MQQRRSSPRSTHALTGALAKVLFLGLFATTACSVITPAELASGIGQPCRKNSDCSGGLCVSLSRFPDSGICSLRCNASADCPAPSECANGECHVPLPVGTTLTGSPHELEGWTYAHVQGLESARQSLPYVHLTNRFDQIPGMVAPELRALAPRNQLVLGNTVDYVADFKSVASEFPGTRFLCVDDGVSTADSANFTTYWVHRTQAWYVAGQIAAQWTRAHFPAPDTVAPMPAWRLGVLSAFVNPETVAAVNAFTLGARSVDPRFVVEVRHVGFWFDGFDGRPAHYTYIHKKDTKQEPRTYFREEYLAAMMVDSGCKVIAHLTNTQRSVRLIDKLVQDKLAPTEVVSLANDNRDGCQDSTLKRRLSTCLGSIYENWSSLYKDLFERVHYNVFDPRAGIDYDMSEGEGSATGMALNPDYAGGAIDKVTASAVHATFLRGAEGQLRRRVFRGPYRINGQRDQDQDGVPDVPELQQITGNSFLDPAEIAKMCWYVEGVVEKKNIKEPAGDDTPALVPGGLVPGSREKNVLVEPADAKDYAIPTNLSWKCRTNVFN